MLATDLMLAPSVIDENTDTSAAAVEVGTLSTATGNGAPSFSLVAGAGDDDNGSFQITGDKLEVKQGVDLDFESQSSYSVRVQISDDDPTDFEETFTISVNDLNDPPEITGPPAFSHDENETAVTTVGATDEDVPAQTLTFSISGGADQGLFTIDSSTGALSFLTAPDFENPTDSDTNNVYEVDVTVTDDGSGPESSTKSLLVIVTDANDAPTIDSASTADVSENTTPVLTVTASDQDGDTPTFSISGGADASLFDIDTNSGALSFLVAPDFEVPGDANTDNDYEVEVTADDGNGGTTTQTITVSVTEVNDILPVFDVGTDAFDVAENTTAVGDVTATDADLPGDTLTYSITGSGADDALFTIDPGTGVLSFLAAPDFEIPGDTDTDNDYLVEVNVNDGTNDVMQTVTVTVTNENEFAPVFTSSDAPQILENTTAVLTVSATDGDGDTVIFSISPTSGGVDAGFFSINETTGELSFDAAPDFENPMDGNTDNRYQVRVTADDQNGSTTEQTIFVEVLGVNDESPVFATGAAFSINENDTSVTTVNATDADLPAQTVTYSKNGGADEAAFTINASTGELSFSVAPDFESPTDAGTDNTYEVVIRANDGNGGTTDQAITVSVLNLNDNSPTFDGGTDSFSVAEGSTSVGLVSATDADLDTLTYSITGSGADDALFTIDPGTGALSFVAAPDFEAPGDADTDNDYLVEVNVSDGTNDVMQTVTVTVTDLNDNPPVFDGGTDAFSVAENTTAVGLVSATDADDDTLTYSIAGGADASLFSIDSNTGSLTFDSAPDFENPSDANTDGIYEVEIEVTDSATPVSQLVLVTVTNVNEFSPVFGSATAVDVVENETAVQTVTATDADGDIPTYTISGGADQASFNINSTTGELSFNVAPDFEVPGDANTDNDYEVEVTANDGNGGVTSQTITVTVLADEDNVPVFDGGTDAFDVAENTTTVGDVTATDADLPGDTLTYSITGSGADDALFTIDPGTGALSFVAAPDFEAPGDADTDNDYLVEVNVSDGTNDVMQTVTVTVTPEEDNVPAFDGGTDAFDVAEGNVVVGNITATDADLPGDTLTYSITGSGTDDALFTIDPGTGALSFVAAPDFETPGDANTDNDYLVEVNVSDGSNDVMQTVTVTVTPEEDNLPVFDGGTDSFDVVENTTAVGDVTATDADLPGDTLTYSITGLGADDALFTIDPGTGALSFVAAPDFETPGDANTDNDYLVEVNVSDGTNDVMQTVTVTVMNANDEPPEFDSGTDAFSIDENTASVGSVSATDPDLDTLTYSITGSGADDALFTIVAATGALSFLSAPDFESPADFNADNVYEVEVQVTDGSNPVAQIVSVSVDPLNDNAPAITSSPAFVLPENTTSVTTVTATDADLPAQTLTFSLSGTDSGLFDIDANSGVLTFSSAPDFENPGDSDTDNVYEVTVTVDDNEGLTDSKALLIVITDANDAPTIDSASTADVSENTTPVLTVTASDQDGDTPTFSISGGADASLFDIDTNSGALSFLVAPDFEVPGDANTDNDYEVEVTADDGNGGTTTQTITVSVTEVNDILPVFDVGTDAFDVAENTTAVGDVTATDADLPGDTLTYSITGSGADDALFTIDPGTGVLSFLAAPDFEIPGDADTDNDYLVEVNVNDGTNDVVQTVTVTVTEVNDILPIFDLGTDAFDVAENTTTVGDVTATDADLPGDTLTYSITGSGADDALFTIDPGTGALSFIAAPDFEAPGDADTGNDYLVEVNVNDGTNNVMQTVTVTVTDVNDNPPVFDGGTDAFSVAENTTPVGVVSATDDLGDTLTYSITGSGADDGLFTIDPGTGALSFVAAPDFETPGDADTDNEYLVEVNVSDGTNDAMQTVTVTVTNENEFAPVFTSSDAPQILENTTAVLTVSATDGDGDTVIFSISPTSGGVDAGFFSINETTGELSFDAAPDFENPMDGNTDNRYQVRVTADDQNGSTTEQTIFVEVLNVNEAPVFTSPSAISVPENATAAATVVATDEDGDTPMYSIFGGADQSSFSIDANTGELTFNSTPDFEAPADSDTDNVYSVIIGADDGNGGAVAQVVSVTVTPVNDNSPIFSNSATFDVVENTTLVGAIAATDDDLPAETVTLSINGGDDAGFFTLSSGILEFSAAPDFETPLDTGSDNTYEVTITADDGNGNTTDQNIVVTVLDGNDNAPTFVTGDMLSLDENISLVDTIVADDIETPGSVTLSIIGGSDAALFELNVGNELSFFAAPDFENPADADTDNVYEVLLQADDGDPSNPLTTGQLFLITVNDVNEAPVFTTSAALDVSENAVDVLTVVATDEDTPPQTVTYSLNGGADESAFSVTPGGALTFNSAPNFESPTDTGSDNTYEVTVRADDGNGGLTDQTIVVTVTDANDSPVFTGSNLFNVSENDAAVGSVGAVDEDGDTQTFSISGGSDASLFAVDANSGAVSFNSAPDFENPTDDNTDNVYELEVTADDGNGGLTTQSVFVIVEDANDSPVFTSPASFDVDENETTVDTVAATDQDGDTPIFSITGGADSSLFSIDSGTGELTFDSAPDFDAPGDSDTDNVYEVEVTADDQVGGTSTQLISVNLQPLNDNSPEITGAAGFSLAENTTSVTTVTATDADFPAQTLTFSLSGTDSGLFDIDANSGVLTFSSAPDFENPGDSDTDNVYEVTVTVDDNEGLTDSKALLIVITDANDAPTIDSASTADVSENTTPVLTVTASDQDGDTPTFSISGGADASLFDIDTNSGALSFLVAPDFEVPGDANTDNDYEVEVTADDGNGGTTAQIITVSVTNENEPPNVEDQVFSVGEHSSNGTPVGSIVVNDPDAGDIPTLNVTGGSGDGIFGVSPTGDITVTDNSLLDFETLGTPEFTLDVTVTDGGSLTDTAVITINITDVTERDADFDQDADVDDVDLGHWQSGYGIQSGANKSDGDANDDGAVSGLDFLLWQIDFGKDLPSIPSPLLAGALTVETIEESAAPNEAAAISLPETVAAASVFEHSSTESARAITRPAARNDYAPVDSAFGASASFALKSHAISVDAEDDRGDSQIGIDRIFEELGGEESWLDSNEI